MTWHYFLLWILVAAIVLFYGADRAPDRSKALRCLANRGVYIDTSEGWKCAKIEFLP